jgi:hypothetical protein
VTKKSEIPFGAQFRPTDTTLEVSEQPLSQILTDLVSPDEHVRGQSLELLAIHLMRLVDLDFKGWLLRSVDSKGIEVGVIAHDKRVLFDRWQIQCLNSKRPGMDEIATAVGRGIFFKPNVLLSMTAGNFTSQARYYAMRAMQLTSLQILLMEAQDLRAIAADKRVVANIINREVGQVEVAKQSQLDQSMYGARRSRP